MKKWMLIMAITLLAACGDSASNNGGHGSSNTANNANNVTPNDETITDKGGPQSLAGFQWTADPVTSNGITLQLAFEFTETEVIAYNTCGDGRTVQTSAPVRYTYHATIPDGDSAETVDGDENCFVEVQAGEFDFEIIDGALHATSMGETVVFDGSNGNSSIYGKWSAEADGLILSWWMGNGSLTAEADCTFNDLKATVEVPATYKNFAVVEEYAEGGDDTCNVSIAAAELEYRFEGDELVLIYQGQETRLSP